ncbi:aromatic amino acid transport family protein [Alteromonas sp. ASW11-36]|uniref:Aromatic amino acid transport family protein n=1 Tax=Alteromonas arenosi TaxID=3055817 RepID=A0ABT7ST71_9ALTE|nr:aromatic amino acid transport family protein [Alteromonas sp. ASW11-36]MDM7859381.1 aromatic amino acid transport family protein [Alteromonas sp. ASW11-36]
MSSSSSSPVSHGILLVIGGAIGAGMFALPMVSAGPWIWWSALGMLIVCTMTYLAAMTVAKSHWKLIHDSTVQIDYSSNFNAIVTVTLGPRWALINNFSITFIMMILMYAYITAGGNILTHTLETFSVNNTSILRPWLSLFFALVIGCMVWFGVSTVSRLLLLLLLIMSLTFFIATSSLLPQIKTVDLVATNSEPIYLLAALPVFVTAFACGGLVPSLVQHYRAEPNKVKQSLLWGAVITLVIYLYWLVVTLGTVSRAEFNVIANSGSTLTNLVEALTANGADADITSRLSLFSHLAIVTSFLSVGVGLLHFIQDKFSLGHSLRQRGVAALMCFAPPALASFFLPYGFVHAISYAGLFVAFSFFVLPGFVGRRVLSSEENFERFVAALCIGFGMLILALKTALNTSLLTQFA